MTRLDLSTLFCHFSLIKEGNFLTYFVMAMGRTFLQTGQNVVSEWKERVKLLSKTKTFDFASLDSIVAKPLESCKQQRMQRRQIAGTQT